MGRQIKGRLHAGPDADVELYDPRKLYSEQHAKAMIAMPRHYGHNNTFVQPLSMTDSGTQFCDADALAAVLSACMFDIVDQQVDQRA